MTTYHKFTGRCSYPQLLTLNRFKKYSVNFYPSAEDRKTIKALGTKLTLKEDDGEKSGVEGFYYSLANDPVKSFGKPLLIFDAAGNPWPKDTLIGNGSVITVDFLVYEGNHPEHGKYKGHRLLEVTVLEHIPYTRPEREPAQAVEEVPVEPAVEAPKTKKPPFRSK